MSFVFSKIFHQAEKTFSLLNNDSIRGNLTILKKLIDNLEINDLGINPHLSSKRAFQIRVSKIDAQIKDDFNVLS